MPRPRVPRAVARSWPARWWGRRSLRARLTLVATALFAVAVACGALLLVTLQREALNRVLDASATKTAVAVAIQMQQHPGLPNPTPISGGITSLQVVDAHDHVVTAGPGSDHRVSILTPGQLARARDGAKLDIVNPYGSGRLRVVGRPVGPQTVQDASGKPVVVRGRTVLVGTDLSRVDDSQRLLTEAALIGSPIAVLLMGLASYVVVALALRPVAELRHGAADITAAGLADQRLPVPAARDEIHRLAVTLNAMLDRIDSATARQRTFVGDAAHELRSPLASLRLQLEVAERLGPEGEWPDFVGDVLVDVGRLERLVSDLLALARLDEGRELRREPVVLADLVAAVVAGYGRARVPVRLTVDPDAGTAPDGGGNTAPNSTAPNSTAPDSTAPDSTAPDGAGRDDAVVSADPDGLRRVVVNLVDNAVRYAHGEVVVALSRAWIGGRAMIRLTVTDDGPGIPSSERLKVFDRFYRIEASRDRGSGGTGLGLPIVRELVRAHGGSVRMADQPDGRSGLQVVVVLPPSS